MSQPLRFSKGGRFTHSVESELIITGLYQCESGLWSWIGGNTKPCSLQIKTVERAQRPDQSLGANVLECYDPASRSVIKNRKPCAACGSSLQYANFSLGESSSTRKRQTSCRRYLEFQEGDQCEIEW